MLNRLIGMIILVCIPVICIARPRTVYYFDDNNFLKKGVLRNRELIENRPDGIFSQPSYLEAARNSRAYNRMIQRKSRLYGGGGYNYNPYYVPPTYYPGPEYYYPNSMYRLYGW